MAALAQETIFLKINNPQGHFWMSTPRRPESIPQSKPRKISPNISRRRYTVSKIISGTYDTVATDLKMYSTIQELLDVPIFFKNERRIFAKIGLIKKGDDWIDIKTIPKSTKINNYIKSDKQGYQIDVKIYTRTLYDTCPICLEYLDTKEVVAAHRVTKNEQDCFKRHLFHKECLERWKENNDFCPLCRGKITMHIYRYNECLKF